MFERILVPTDGSPCSRAAVQLAMRVGKTSGSELFLCHVIEPAFAPEPLKNGAGKILEQAAAIAKAYPRIETMSRHGRAVQEIVKAAKEKRADLIIMGSHGERGLPQLFLGSVAEGVLRCASVPVMIVPLEAAHPRKCAASRHVA